MVELIERGEPAIMLCHWPGLYNNDQKDGLRSFQKVVSALDGRFRDQTIWMKLTEIARYWAAKEVTQIKQSGGTVSLAAPFAAPGFTVRFPGQVQTELKLVTSSKQITLKRVSKPAELKAGTWMVEASSTTACIDLPQGESTLRM